jgi:hypothetical protein
MVCISGHAGLWKAGRNHTVNRKGSKMVMRLHYDTWGEVFISRKGYLMESYIGR